MEGLREGVWVFVYFEVARTVPTADADERGVPPMSLINMELIPDAGWFSESNLWATINKRLSHWHLKRDPPPSSALFLCEERGRGARVVPAFVPIGLFNHHFGHGHITQNRQGRKIDRCALRAALEPHLPPR